MNKETVNRIDRLIKLIELNKKQLANKELDLIMSCLPEHPFLLELLIHPTLDLGRSEDTHVICTKLLSANPNSAEAFAGLAALSYQKEQYSNAEQLIWQAIEQEPQNSNLKFLAANIALQAGKQEEAVKLWSECLASDPDNENFQNMRWRFSYSKKKWKHSIELLVQALQKNPESKLEHEYLGKCYLLLGRPKRAAAFFKEALRINPEDDNLKESLKHALRSRFFFYGLGLRAIFALVNSRKIYLILIVIAIILFFGWLRSIGYVHFTWLGFVLSTALLVFLLVLFSYTLIRPISNGFILFDPVGKKLFEDRLYKVEVAHFIAASGFTLILLIGFLSNGAQFFFPGFIVLFSLIQHVRITKQRIKAGMYGWSEKSILPITLLMSVVWTLGGESFAFAYLYLILVIMIFRFFTKGKI